MIENDTAKHLIPCNTVALTKSLTTITYYNRESTLDRTTIPEQLKCIQKIKNNKFLDCLSLKKLLPKATFSKSCNDLIYFLCYLKREKDTTAVLALENVVNRRRRAWKIILKFINKKDVEEEEDDKDEDEGCWR